MSRLACCYATHLSVTWPAIDLEGKHDLLFPSFVLFWISVHTPVFFTWLSLSVRPSVHLSVYVNFVCLSNCVSVYICLSVCLCSWLFVYLSVCLSLCLSNCLSVCKPVFLAVSSSIYCICRIGYFWFSHKSSQMLSCKSTHRAIVMRRRLFLGATVQRNASGTVTKKLTWSKYALDFRSRSCFCGTIIVSSNMHQ